MLGARNLYTISKQLCYALNCHTEAFGGMNIILAGDFAQLPPISQYTLYSGSIGTKKLQGVTNEIQEATIGKAAWHQFTTVVILRENMQQTTQSTEDGKLHRALQNMRYKACTTADISFLRTLVGGRPANKVKLNQARFHKYNMLGASNILSLELQHVVWNLPHEASQHCAGKLSICHGMPVLVKHNIATLCCVTNSAEGTVVGWKSSKLTTHKNILDILFVKLNNPPVPINLYGLPMNVVPIGRTAQDVICRLPNDDTLTITRQQVQVLPNFSMTDYGCQGRTRPNNVVDLGGCLTHQSYYTCLSRSASASGTPNKIMGGASGYERNLPSDIIGDRRNTIIREYQLWKGSNFVPKHVHAALCWSNEDPFPFT
ncbi:hypothetical protein K439DRAFT_1648445 [Ramaria rubella]|nr:hypothetical protein K439DRAFT_1648445 [Ramaria rubella]